MAQGKGRRKLTIEDRIADRDRSPKRAPLRSLKRPRTCAWCGERDAHVEYHDEEKDKWLAVCDQCNAPVPAPDALGAPGARVPWLKLMPGSTRAERLAAAREAAKRQGRCTMCRARDARVGMLTCQPCSDRGGWEQWDTRKANG